MKKNLWLLIIMFFVLVFGQSSFALADSKGKTITLGHLNCFSGGASLYGNDGKRSIILAVEEINAKGGITVGGEKYFLKAIHLDNKYKPAPTVAGYRRLVDLHDIHFIHNMGSMTGAAIMQYNEKDQVLLDVLTPADSSTLSGNKLILNQVARPNGYDRPVVKQAIKQGLKSMCIIADDSDFGREHSAEIIRTFEKLGGKILAVEYVRAHSGADFMPVLTKLKAYKPDSMFVVAVEEPGSRIAKQAREAGISASLLFTEHFKKKIIDVVGIDKLEGTIFAGTPTTLMSVSIAGTPEGYLKYTEKYRKRWPGKYISAVGPYSYNWVYYITKAMQIAGTTTDAWKVRKVCSQAIREGWGIIEFKGFTNGGRGYGQPTYVMGISDEKVRVIKGEAYPKELAAVGEK